MSKVLLAGGAGFIGCHITEMLLAKGEEVWVLDNFSSGSMNNLGGQLDNPNLHVVNGDVRNPYNGLPRFDMLVHMACVANPTDYERDPVAILEANSIGTGNLLRMAQRSNGRFIFFSSSEVYGNVSAVDDNHLSEVSRSLLSLGNSRSCYSFGKCYGEEYVRAFCEKHKIDYAIVRPFNVYGDRMDVKSPYGRVIPNFVRNALIKAPLEVNGDGTQTRSFLHVDDFTRCYERLIGFEQLGGKTLNIGHPEPIQIIALAVLVNELFDNKGNIHFAPRFPNEPERRSADITMTRRMLGWEPVIELKDGLMHMARQMKSE
jgi:nucleoside-diphosphate-sugar epimerase